MTIKQKVWFVSYAIALVLLACIVFSLSKFLMTYNPNPEQLESPEQVNLYLTNLSKEIPDIGQTIKIPTGFYIESMKFNNAYTVDVSGYVWQRYDKNFPENIAKGVIFPEASGMRITQEYVHDSGHEVTIGWYFEGHFNLNFIYLKYPLDNQVVSLRVWSKDFENKVLLVPDLRSYVTTKATETFGVDKKIQMGGFTLLETFFSYETTPYDTDFGISDVTMQTDLPELHFNIAIERNVLTIFITNLLPLILVIILTILALKYITSDVDRRKLLGSSLASVAAICSSMLFIVLVAHVRLRESIAEGNPVYLEYIYFVVYFALIYLIMSAFLIIIPPPNKITEAIARHDGLYLKAAFLPLIFGLILIITQVVIWS